MDWMLEAGGFVGEASLSIRCPRIATVAATTACRLLSWKTATAHLLPGVCLEQTHLAIAMHTLQNLPIFSTLSDAHLRPLAAALEVAAYASGTVICPARDAEERLF